MGRAVEVYHRLPPPAKDLAASARGLYLRRWRYGRETEELVSSALERDYWTAQQWSEWREERLGSLLHRAATTVPYYQQHWTARRRRGDRASWDDLRNWPVLTKDIVRQNVVAFVSSDADRRLFTDNTSGTTGTPLKIKLNKEAVRTWYAIYEARIRRWNGTTRWEPWAILGGQLIVPADRSKPPFWVRNRAMRQLYLSTFHLARHNAGSYVEAMRSFGITHLVAYPASAAILASWIVEDGLDAPRLKVVAANAEGVTPAQRDVIEQAFKSPVRETYGMGEAVTGASECTSGTLHWWPDAGIVEKLPRETSEHPEIVATGLINRDMPLIRYRTGDLVDAASETGACACGRGLPAVGRIVGRASDMIVTPDGRHIFWVNPIFYGLPIRHAQVVQTSERDVAVAIQLGEGASKDALDEVRKRLKERVGDMNVAVTETDAFRRDRSGKIRPVIGLGGR